METLLLTAISIALIHTLTGPDHYLPFIALSRARNWSITRTVYWTVICGLGHVLSSVVLALGGAAIGWSLSKVNMLEDIRGGVAGWFMFLFGIGYLAYGLYRLYIGRPHKHFELNDDGSIKVYEHQHPHHRHSNRRGNPQTVTPWVLFVIFLLGPCEPMIPLLSFPAAQQSWGGMLLLIFTYSFFTIATMLLIVVSSYYGLSVKAFAKMEKYTHVLAGATIVFCGISMLWLGW